MINCNNCCNNGNNGNSWDNGNGEESSGLKTECGVFGIFSFKAEEDVIKGVVEGLKGLQHRGQESAGVSYAKDNQIVTHKKFGFVEEAFLDLKTPKTNVCIGHVRYSTSGGTKNIDEVQPISNGHMALSHNGNVPNLPSEYDHDTTFLFHTIDQNSKQTNGFEALKDLVRSVPGAFCLLILYISDKGSELFVLRDRFGIRPLCLGFNYDDKRIYASSESSALPIDAKNIKHVRPGAIWRITMGDDDLYTTTHEYPNPSYNVCMFEFIYFLRPETIVDGLGVEKFRCDCGVRLAEKECLKFSKENTIVVGAPFTGIASGTSYANKLGLIYKQLLTKHRKKRTFILPKERKKACDTIYQIDEDEIRGKVIVLLDDSVVRGNTLKSLAERFWKAGAKEFHIRVASPPVISSCKFGIDIPTKSELIAHRQNSDIEKIKEELHVSSLVYLDIKDMAEIFANNGIGNFCGGCFTGKYPPGLLDW